MSNHSNIVAHVICDKHGFVMPILGSRCPECHTVSMNATKTFNDMIQKVLREQ